MDNPLVAEAIKSLKRKKKTYTMKLLCLTNNPVKGCFSDFLSWY